MKIFKIIACILVVLVVATRAKPQFRIVDGEKAEKGEWPWQLALWQGPIYMCGASIIDSTWAVSAAHCIGAALVQYLIIAGTNINDIKCKPGDCLKRKLVNAIRHPEFVSVGVMGFPNDISYLAWKEPIKEQSSGNIVVKYVARATKNDQVGKNCYITGWGRIRGNGPFPKDLLETRIDVMTNEQCRKTWGSQIYDSHVCVQDLIDFSSSACNGDSGGPLVCEVAPKKWELVGATSWGAMECNTSYPTVYTRISSFNKWLDAQAQGGH